MLVRAVFSSITFVLGGCSGAQSMLAPAGPGADAVADLWWLMFRGAAAILALVIVLTLYAVYRDPERRSAVNTRWLIVGGGVGMPFVLLSALLVYGFRIETPLQTDPEAVPLLIEVTGHQWWWEVRYPDKPGAVTANEIHVPVGRPVRVELRSADVIHSFWVPRLAGKVDMIPGHENALEFRADTPGAYRGQCAEFCGAQHAHMVFWVIAQPPAQFESWLERQRQPAAAASGTAAQRGQAQFLAQGCPDCHTVRGTRADGDVGPDLTHVSSRRSLAAGTLPVNRANLARWIARNQQIKPGNRMKSFAHLEEQVLADIAAYLEGLE